MLVQGGGLAGLTAALSLAQAGRSVVLTERLPRLGGRCGQFVLDDHRFTIGCNDFGARIGRDLESLGVSVPFEPSTNVLDLGDAVFRLPPGPRAALRLLRHVPSLLRLVHRVRRGGPRTLGELYREHERNDFGFRLAGMIAYALGCPPSLLRADGLAADFGKEHRYGHDRMVVPVGGPQVITDAMEARLRALGVTIWTETEVGVPTRDGDRFVASSPRGELEARAVVAMARPDEPDAPRSRPGLAVAQLLWAADPSVPFVEARALIVSPPSPDRWMMELHEGRWPERYGHHLFRDVVTTDEVTLTGYLLVPRGQDRLSEAERAAIQARVEESVEAQAPGFRKAIRYRRVLDPHEYQEIHGLGCALSVRLPSPAERPLPVEVEPGRYRMGNGVGPPGDHANAAMLSGLWAAEKAQAYLSRAS